jgi:hypothetical protein
MTERNTRFRNLLVVALALGCATSCRSSSPARPAVDWELRSFEVPAADREAAAEVLSTLLTDKGRVRTGPDGRLLVLAAPDTHKQIQQEMLDPLLKRPRPAPSEPPSFTTAYWMLLVRPLASGARPPVPSALKEIAEVLPEIEKVSGPAELVLLDRLRLKSNEGEAETTGRLFEVKQKASLTGPTVVGEISIQTYFDARMHRTNLLKTRVSLKTGQLAVIGEIGLPSAPNGWPKAIRPPEAGDTLYLILKASVDDAIARK